jgi:predicted DNA-binding ribbon-helix-helix protein
VFASVIVADDTETYYTSSVTVTGERLMGRPISVRLEERVQETLAEVARERGVGLSTLLRDLAADEARRLRRERIREQSRRVGERVASDRRAREFYEDWGTPSADVSRH